MGVGSPRRCGPFVGTAAELLRVKSLRVRGGCGFRYCGLVDGAGIERKFEPAQFFVKCVYKPNTDPHAQAHTHTRHTNIKLIDGP